MNLMPKRASESATEMVQVVLPNDANPLGYILGGTVIAYVFRASLFALMARPLIAAWETAKRDGVAVGRPEMVREMLGWLEWNLP